MRQAGRTQAYLRQLQAIAHLHQAVFVGNKHVVKANFAMTAMLFGAHDVYASHNLPARIVFMEQKSRQPLAGIVRSAGDEIGRASWRERVSPSVSNSVVGVTLKKK